MSNTWFRLRRGFFLSFFPSDTPHYENVLPDGWCLTDIGELLINRDGERKPVSSVIRSKQTSKIYDYYGAAGVIDKVDSYLFDERLLLIGEDGANLLSRSKNNAFFAEGRYWVNNHAHVLDATDKNLLDFIAIVINSMKLDDYITGSAQPKLSQDNLNKIPIVLPPLAEQQRIIAEIKKWFTLIDQIEQDKADLQTTIELTKSKILDLAIHGKLIPQDPNDEPAIELLKRINPDFTPCDNGHYPVGWIETILGELFSHNTGKALNSSNKEGIFKDYLTTSNVYWNKFDFTAIKQMPFKESELNKCTVTKGDLLVCEGGDIGRSAIWNYDYDICIQNHIHRLRPKIDLCVPFYYYTFAYLKENNLIGGKGIGLLGLSSNALHKIEMPLPPLAEQQRIVQKIEELFSVLDNIQNALEV
ncbi:restriction endonuclease subunit S [Phocaeicola vulgatus]|jgi:type I restriction enzyme S subunit|uniref:Restriction endonuclease subunit S n=1 Tax=Phocaeicola vulgatus TaxID=821 RepID=A0A848QW51_PHOVU|nr:restriction endonuclease subunit S [Phocaeicola vulgatus]KAB6542851.1 restriction endonuclease subunit S [Phocaeicola vulgatus]NMW41248.1 restriction endonuclease subunit S [Phocaeicola vulgatus]RHE55607.1 restriction endonuclease subunit S [Phocaeicola vulgatus]